MEKIKTGLIGYGLSGRVFHAPFLFTHPGFELKKIVERKKEDSLLVYPDISIVKDYKELLDDRELDLIVVGVPNRFHYGMVKDSLEAGKHVVVEKPFTPTSEEAGKLIQLAKEVDRKIFVYQNRRWDGDFLTIKKILEQKDLGKILEYEAHFDRFTPDTDCDSWRDQPRAGSGILFDLGSHLIDQAIQLFGYPKYVFADIKSMRETSLVDDYFDLHLFYEKMKVILKAGMFVKETGPRYIIHGTLGSFVKYEIDPQEETLKKGTMPQGEDWGKEQPEFYGLLNTTIDEQPFFGKIETEPGNYHGFYDNVYDVIINGAPQEVKPIEAKNIIRIIELAFESADKGEIVNFKE